MAQEEDSNQANESSGDVSGGPVCGERLAKARHDRGISVSEIAKELHLDVPKVRALEENRFEVLGAPVFAKGHLRKYAELMDVKIDDILADYYRLNRSVGAPPVVGPPRKNPRDISIGPWVVGVVVVAVIASAAWWWMNLELAPESAAAPAAVGPATLAPFESDRQDDSNAEASDDETVRNEELTASPDEEPDTSVPAEALAEEEAAVVQEMPQVESELEENAVELVLSFSGDCWTEVTDATGRRLFFDLGTDGRSVTLTGAEPLGVLLGNGSNVSIRVNGVDYSISAANRRGNTARLTIYGQ